MNLPVAVIESALPFYTSLLGFIEVSRSEKPNRSAVQARDNVQMQIVDKTFKEFCVVALDGLCYWFREAQKW
ncbi:MAG: hypothetical protein ABJB66_03050 [Gemmatimonadaceae bacterium]